MALTNKHNISFSLAAFLCRDDYDHSSNPKQISATSLIKPIKATILSTQHPGDTVTDIADLIASRMGSAMHAWLEASCKDEDTLQQAYDLSDMDVEELVVVAEKRSKRKIKDWIISGKFDLCINGQLIDLKTCSVWSDIYDSNREDYILQGSIYKWLNPTLILSDTIQIDKIFTDWSAKDARQKGDSYPPIKVATRHYPLLPLDRIEEYIEDRISKIEDGLKEEDQANMPMCTDAELWRSDTKYKVFKTDKSNRAINGGVKDTISEAEAVQMNKGGVIKVFPGEIRRCKYCNAAPICKQAVSYIGEGLLFLD